MTAFSPFDRTPDAATAPSPARFGRRGLTRTVLSAAIVVGCLLWFVQTVTLPSWNDVKHALIALPPSAWGWAAFWTAISLWAVGGYDAIWHKTYNTGISTTRSRISGMAAVGLGQTTGASAFVSALVRWRMMPSLGVVTAGALTASVAFSFILAWGALTACVVIVWGVRPDLLALCFVFLAGLGVLLALGQSLGRVTFFGRQLSIPPLKSCARMFVLTALDTAAAAMALYVLLPFHADLIDVFALYLLALGAALISNTPAGVGPFDLTLLAGFAMVGTAPDTAALMASLVAFRVVYYLTPALISLCVIGASLRRPLQSNGAVFTPSEQDVESARQAKRSETLLIHHPKSSVLKQGFGGASWLVRRLDRTLVALFDPLMPPCPTHLDTLQSRARQTGHKAIIYKCSKGIAAMARAKGWQTLHIADEAEVPTAPAPNMQGAQFRQLRRKLRKAQAAGVTISHRSQSTPIDDLIQVSAVWQANGKPERGFSMGQMAPEWIARQRVYSAHHAGQTIGFVSFHHSKEHWTLDLMRLRPDAPDGTMHALIRAALTDAKNRGIASVSLAAAPRAANGDTAPTATFAQKVLASASKGDGLRQFKQSFAPDWQPLYACAPSKTALLFGGAEVARRILSGDAERS